jgi:multiple sugar transport system ATP-binding protein
MAQVRVEQVWKFYRQEKKTGEGVTAVKDANFVCEDNEFLCMLGPSGCGKSSTLRMIAGLEKISRGNIYIGDTRVNDLSPKDRKIAMAFESYALYPPLTIYENIAFPLMARGYSKEKIQAKVKMVTELLEIEDILNHRPAALSGGEQQRVSLARALVREDSLVTLMDEPISHLDAQLKARLRIDLKRIQEEWGLTVLYVTHDQLEALSMADKVVVMNLAEIQQIGTPIELLEKPANLFVAGFVGEPPMNFLNFSYATENGKSYLSSVNIKIEVEPELASILEKGNRNEWVLGIRPHDIIIGEVTQDAYSVKANIYGLEPLGETTVLIVFVNDQQLFVEVPGQPSVQEGESINLFFKKDKIHIFHSVNGKAVY